ncbi:MAG: ABC transporter ATP-binding protein/permease [Lachnospiraceae bacterium]|nr:ABC transporter ATP-binding protein/permease [Lachnospiraceae bacterium]
MKKRKHFFLRYMAKYSYLLIGGLLVTGLLSLAVVRGTSVISGAIDDMLSGKEIILGAFLPEFIALTLAGFVLAFLGQQFGGLMYSVKVIRDYRIYVVKKLYRIEYAYLKKENMATIINKINSDMAEAESFLQGSFPALLNNVAALVIYAAYVGSLNISLLLVLAVSYPVVFWISSILVKKIGALTGTYRAISDVITGIAQDALSGILVLRSFGLEDYFQKRMQQATKDLVDNEEKRTSISNIVMLVRKMVQWLPNIICAVYAVVLVSRGDLSLGGLLAFVVMLERLVGAFIGIPFIFVEAVGNIVCIRRIEEILNTPDEISGTETDGKTDNDVIISLKNISFGYMENNTVLDGIDLAVRTGENIALVGASGGGKSTLFNLLCAFYTPDSGSYQLYGREIIEWNAQAARERMALVSQNVFLFPTTVEENIAYGNPDATHEEIVEACKKAQIHDFIMTLPQGYQTVTGERGAILSGGQKQRISIARAILKNAPILLLDEPTSAVDVETEELIQKALENVMKGRTCITIAHRLSTIQNADCIYVMSGGKIVEHGTHAALLDANGVYAKLYASG